MSEDVDLEIFAVNPVGPEAGGLLSIAPRIYREFADDYKKPARTTTDIFQRELYLKMASTWVHAAIRFESGVETSGLTARPSPTEDDQRDLRRAGATNHRCNDGGVTSSNCPQVPIINSQLLPFR
jgi:hypothetical protein